MYPFVLSIHSLLRWAVLATGAVAFGRVVAGIAGRREWTPTDAKAGLWFTIAMDAQLLIGLALYVALSPIMRIAFQDFGGAMGNSTLRFWAIEHIFGMTLGVALIHIGRIRIRKAAGAVQRHRLAAIFFGLALLAIIATIPWPGLPAGRPLFRF